MLSAKLIQTIEQHYQAIGERFLRQVRSNPNLPHMQKLLDSELGDRARAVARNLGRFLIADEKDWSARYEALGRTRCRERIPLHEVVLALHILKTDIMDFVRNQGMGGTSVELYAEEELEHMVSAFFDTAVYHAVRGYEEALRELARPAVS
jgi:hypothetical protein